MNFQEFKLLCEQRLEEFNKELENNNVVLTEFGITDVNEKVITTLSKLSISESMFKMFIVFSLRETKEINTTITSYYLKHSLEAKYGYYITNGQMILLMKIFGFKHQLIVRNEEYTANLYFNASI